MASKSRLKQSKTDSTAPGEPSRPFVIPDPKKTEEAKINPTESGTDASTSGYMLKPRPFTITVPPPDDLYLLREEDIDALAEGGKNESWEIALASAGTAFGFLQNLVNATSSIAAGKLIGTWNAFAAVICIIAVVLTIVKFIEFTNVKNKSVGLKEKIKAGQKAKIGHAE